MLRAITFVGVLALVLGLAPAAAIAQTGANVLVVVNDASPDSVRIGQAYATARRVPDVQVVHIVAPSAESIERADFQAAIETPIRNWIVKHRLHDQILYIVLTKGVPIRVVGTGGPRGTVASVDSELTLLYRKLVGQEIITGGRVENPYFLGRRPQTEARRFTRHAADIYLVTRLDGFTADDALALIERAVKPATTGQLVFDQRATFLDRGGDSWLEQAAALTNQQSPGRAVLESTRGVAQVEGSVLGYYSWGSNDPAIRRRGSGLRFAPGAIGGMFVSTDGRTFSAPPDDWLPGESERRGGYYASGSQSIAGDLIREGITGVSAHVEEPYLDATIRPQILFPAYLSGFTLAESYYLAMPYLSWQTMVIGDPLAAPFSARQLTDAEIHKGLDEGTGLPALFASRRLALLARTGLNRDALTLSLLAERLFVDGDSKGVEQTLIKAAALEPRLISAHLQLAGLYEQTGAHDQARGRYEAVLAVNPDHAVALNNLAYSLAVHANDPAKALPFAERALRRADLPTIVDTVAWIHYLLGNSAAALPLIDRAAAALPDDVEVLVHAAIIRHAAGDGAGARAALNAALKLDPAVAARSDLKALLGSTGSPPASRD
jgi:uncharacterized protein (TIGR03790 family)